MRFFIKILIIIFFIYSCSNDYDDNVNLSENENLNIEDFIYKSMNSYYLWNDSVQNLNDSKFVSDKDYFNFLESSDGPYDLFDKLKFTDDRFSIITNDYIRLQNQFNSISLGNGMKFGLKVLENNYDIIGYVRYVLEGSNADLAGIKRGTFFSRVNQTELNTDNYRELLFSNSSSYSIGLAKLENNEFKSLDENIHLINSEILEKELHTQKIIAIDNKRIGYLFYNGFNASQQNDLSITFEEFKNSNINELIVDLRYNPGGSVQNTQFLAGLIAGEKSGQIFANMNYNNKLARFNRQIEIIDSNLRLGLSRIYFLVSKNSASASELLINGLDPHIETIVIGTNTYGKNVGGSIIYDYISEQIINPNHFWALYPVIFSISNSLGFDDYSSGLIPDIFLEENLSNLGEIGNISEPLLKIAIEHIIGREINTNKSSFHNQMITKEIMIENGLMFY